MGGRGAVAVGMCVCMCVEVLRVDKEETGLGDVSEQVRWDFDNSAVGCCPAAGRESEQRWRELWAGEVERGKIRVRVPPRFLSFLVGYTN